MSCCTGRSFTICLSEGIVHAFGDNFNGQLGIENLPNGKVSIPTRIESLPPIKIVSCGYLFTICVDESGSLWSFGDNVFGQLGTGKSEQKFNVPQKIGDIPLVKTVACGGFHALVITEDNTLWSAGANNYLQLFLNREKTLVERYSFSKTQYSNVTRISTGFQFSMLQNDSEEIFSCGINIKGELGLGDNTFHGKAQKIPDLPLDIIHFCCGKNHSLFLDINGNVFSVGDNTSGNLGIGDLECRYKSTLQKIPNIPPIADISCTGSSSFLIDYDGCVWSFGDNESEQLGHGDNGCRYKPTKVTSLTGVKQISSGFGSHFLAKTEVAIYGCGSGGTGQLGEYGENGGIPNRLKNDHFKIWGDKLNKTTAKSARK